METLHFKECMFQNNVDGFCIVSSDSDFTRLANRLREGGKLVVGMGMSSASKTFISACNDSRLACESWRGIRVSVS